MTYLDHAATTPMLPAAVAAMSAALSVPGNASSLHASGRRARRAVEEARETVAAAFGATPAEVIFTGGGTEGDNLAVKGIYWARNAADPRRTRVVVSPTEHHAVLDAAAWLAAEAGAEVITVGVDALGRVTPEALRAVLAAHPNQVALVSVMLANNEVGTVNPVRSLAAVAAEFDVPLHTDAVQAPVTLPVDFADLGVAALTLTGHKLGGPYGLGALLLRRDVTATPLLHGGGQEREVRSGTLDVPAILGLAAAVGEVTVRRTDTAQTLAALADSLLSAVRAAVPDVELNGDPGTGLVDGLAARLPGNVHLSFPGCAADALLACLDAAGIECSTGSACTAGVAAPSHVLLAMGRDADAARGSLRFSLGHTSTADDVAALAAAIGPAVARLREPVRGLR